MRWLYLDGHARVSFRRAGNLEVVVGDIGGRCYTFSSRGETLSTCSSSPLASPTLGDVDGDGKVDIEAQYYVESPALGDFDRDGMVEIATCTGVTQTEARYNSDKFPWPMFRHDCRHTGCYGPPVEPPPPPTNYETYILLQNANSEGASVVLTYTMEDGVTGETVRVDPESRKTVYVNESVGIGKNCCSFSTRVESSRPVCCERAMYFDNNGRPGGHNSIGATSPSEAWHFAEGYTAEYFDTWILIQNPTEMKAVIKATFMKPGWNNVEREYRVGPGSRYSIEVDAIPGLEATEVSTSLESANGTKFIAERAIYFNHKGV